MAAEEYGLDQGYSAKTKRNPIELLVVAVLAIAVIATLILAIVVLVKVNDASSPTTVVASGPSTTSPVPATTTSGQQLGMNIPTLPPIASNDPKYDGYSTAVNQLTSTINIAADPCNDFWNYVCGSYPSTLSSSFAVADNNNYAIQANQIMNQKYQQQN
uniref:Peptidase M13 N-terminal domain-containing protein n=1 Tax=Plectus sambesii TaxID=2011161 RepID=A0A914UZH8_9BILA